MQTVIERNKTFQPSSGQKVVHVPYPHPKSEVAAGAPISGILGGITTNFIVYYDSQLGQIGEELAQAILQVCEDDYHTLQGYFNNVRPNNLPFTIVLTTDNTGAGHDSCEATTLYIGARSGPDVNFIRSLVIAEEDEVFEATIGLGWECGASNGEGLSRVLANDMYQGVEPANFMSASVWLNTPDRPDFVNRTDPTDTNYVSIGCSVLFLNWLRFQLGSSWREIITNGAPTLAETYQNLTHKSDGWQEFRKLIDQYYPIGTLVDLKTDNPFPLPRTGERAKATVPSGRKVPTRIELEEFSEAIVSGTLRALSAHQSDRLHDGNSAVAQLLRSPVVRTGILFEITNETSIEVGAPRSSINLEYRSNK